MKNFKINANNIALSGNHIEITIPDNLKFIKVVDAILNVKIASVSSNNDLMVNYSAKKGTNTLASWNNVDTIKNISAGNLSINISDELQNSIDLNAKLNLDFIGNGEIIFINSESNLSIDYISLEEYQGNGNSHKIDLGKAGNASINLATGQLNIKTPLISSDENVLPISISANYNATKNTKLPDIGLPEKWSLNVNQFLIKNETENDKTSYTYIDENGKNQIIEEKYYYTDDGNTKHFIEKDQITVDLDGNLKYNNKEVKTELEAPSGIKLISSIKDFEGSDLVDYEPEELANLKRQIEQLEEQKDIYKQNIYNYQKQLCLLAISKYISLNNNISTYSSNYPVDEASANSINLLANGNNEKYNFDTDYTGKNLSDLEEEAYDRIYKKSIDENVFKNTILAFVGKSYFEYGANTDEEDVISEIFNEYMNASNDRQTYFKEKLNLSDNEKNNFGLFYTYNDNNFYNIAVQINNYKDQLVLLKKQLDEIENELSKYNHQKEQYEMQVPVHYLYNDDNIFYGFGKTRDLNVFRLVLIMDMYENTIYFSYNSLDSNKIESIMDSNEKTIIFNYENNLLTEITDARDRKVKFNYNETNILQNIEHLDNNKSYYYYIDTPNNDDQETSEKHLQAALNQTGIGVQFSYDKNKISNASMISFLDNIRNNVINYKKINNENFSFESLDFSNNDYSSYKISDKSINFSYQNYKSTSLSNSKNKQVTYLFDKYGKVRTIYENNFNENSLDNDEINFKAKEFTYQDNKINMKVNSLPYAKNYLEDVAFKENEKTIENGFYLGTADAVCSASTIPFNYEVNAKFYEIKESETTKAISVLMTPISIDELNKELVNNESNCSHRAFMVSGWAKADSAFVITDEQTKDNNGNNIYPDYINNRKFEIRAEITYQNDANIRKFARQFDWRNTEWQYCSLPLILEDKTIESINCYIDYSGNTGDIIFTDLTFKQADFEITDYDSFKRPIKNYSAHSNFIITYEYENEETKNPCKQIITNIAENKDYITTFEYTKEGKLLRSIDYNGIVKENVFNDQGVVIKTITYHQDELTNKFYEEKKLDEKGKETASINELGEETASYEYINGTGIISSSIDENGVKTSYGYSPDDTLLETSITTDGIENTNTYGYNLDFLTSLKHNDFEIGYDYDEQGRIKQINIAGNEYLTKEYGENEEITSLASNEIYRQTFNDNGDVLNTYYKPNENAEEITLVENIYDTYGNIIKTKDFIDKPETAESNEHSYFYDKFGNTIKETNTQHNSKISIENEMDSSHSNIQKSTIKIGDETLIYEYDRDETPDAKLNTITLPNGIEQTLYYDKLQRVKNIQTEDYVKQFTYLKNGDHTSNLVSKLQFAIGDVNKDNLTYKYDKKGNITEIRENNKLLARYQYDALSRIIREDNSLFNKTFTYSYDGGGNITQRSEYAFILSDNLDFETPTGTFDYSYSSSGWKDQLKEYNGQKFVYDSLGNPTTYRAKTLLWSHGRQLDYFDVVKDTENNITNFKAKYTYNASGIRTSKAINVNMLECNCGKEDCNCNGTFTISFFLNGNKIIKQHDCCNDLIFYYAADGITGFHLKNNLVDADFYYKKNAQNDVIGIYSSDNKEIARYEYDAWGNCVVKYLQDDGTYAIIDNDYSYNDTTIINRFIAFKNPFRYRSYYYDFETNLYYLNSRYYDPQLGRFLNADDISTLDITQIALNGLNLYAYCLNNPVNEVDENGYFISFLIGLLIAAAIGAAVGAVSYTASVVIKGVTTGKWEWNWAEFLGSVVGGFVGGAFSIIPFGGSYISAFMTGLFTNIFTDAFSHWIYGTEFNIWVSAWNGFKDGLASTIFVGLMGSKYAVKGISFGRGSWSAVTDQIYRKFRRDLIKKISWKTFGKMFGLSLYESVIDIFKSALT